MFIAEKSFIALAAGLLLQSHAFAANINLTIKGTPVATVPVSVVAPTSFFSYQVQVIPLDYAIDMNDGIILGTSNGIAAAYVNGQVILLPGLTGYRNIELMAVASNGYIVGQGTKGADTCGLFWASYTSTPIEMGCPGLGAITQVFSVNAQGVAVGSYFPQNTGQRPTAFAWSISGGMRSIAPQGSELSQAFSISDSGYVAGEAYYGGQQSATRWYPGSFQAGTTGYSDFGWRAMENGTIFSYTTSWDLNDQAQTIAPNSISRVWDISEYGRKVGTIYQTSLRAWTTVPTNNSEQLLPLPAGNTASEALRVNACGSILGIAFTSDNVRQSVLWSKGICDSSSVAPVPPTVSLP
jgi:hypothetical protein